MDWTINSPQISSNQNFPFTRRHGLPLFEYLDHNSDKATRFARGMGGAVKFNRQAQELFTGYSWESLYDGKIVDVGGGSGHISMKLVEIWKQFPTIRLVVQDKSKDMLAQGPKLDVYTRIQDRVTFTQYGFFMPQPINDTLLPEPGAVTQFEEHNLRQLDMLMMVILGANQRSEKQFRELLKMADNRFEVIKVSSEGSIGLIEVHLKAVNSWQCPCVSTPSVRD